MTNRERLLDVGRRAFVEHGFEAVGVQQIVQAAGVTKPSLYHHFGSKRGLLEALVTDLQQELQRRIGPALVYNGDVPRDLTSLIHGFFTFAQAEPERFHLLFLLRNAPIDSEARITGRRVTTWLDGALRLFFEQAAAEHGNMAGRERLFSISLLGTLFAYGLLLADGEAEFTHDLAHQVMRQFSYGVYS